MANNKSVQTIDDQNFESQVLGSERPYLLEFGATWCGPCRRLAPIVEDVAVELAGQVHVGAIDIDQSPETSTRLGVRSAPTLIVFQNGAELARHVGLTKKERILELLGAAT